MRNTSCTDFRGRAWRSATLLASLLAVLAWFVLAPRALSANLRHNVPSTARPPVTATLLECVTSEKQAERAATFSGEMSALPGSAKMEMRIDVLERLPTETAFHLVSAEGLGVWRTAAPGVKTYKYIKQVTNLAAPAYYRGAVHFRWLNAKGKLIRASELRTARCLQTVPVSETPSGAEQAPSAG